MRTTLNEAILRSVGSDGKLVWRRYRSPIEVLTAYRMEDVLPVIAQAESLALEGLTCVGYVAYEAASAFDSSLATHPSVEGLPLALFGAFEASEEIAGLPQSDARPGTPWIPVQGRDSYEGRVSAIKDLIGAGDLYQANFTAKMASESHDPWALFLALANPETLRHSAYLDMGRFVVCSASPESFFERDGRNVATRPMKGTAPRGRFPAEDERVARQLQESEKNRAENLMIVDMARNDLGRIAEVGSVSVEELFSLERYSTVWQLTSKVSARTDAGLVDLFRALFPAASITGAPKKRAMEVIREMEDGPRGVYTGCIGSIGPGPRARFNVAIRTAVLDRRTDSWSYGVGGGIVWDSEPADEYEECLAKALILQPSQPFSLFESIRWDTGIRSPLLPLHLDRLLASARFFDFPLEEDRLLAYIADIRTESDCALRLECDSHGRLSHRLRPLPVWPEDRKARVALSPLPVDGRDRFLFHKTTMRDVYDQALERMPGFDEVLLTNREGFVTEGTRSNLAVRLNDRLVTPPLEHGLLPGVMRRQLLESGEIDEGPVRLENLRAADEILLFNALRGITRAELIE